MPAAVHSGQAAESEPVFLAGAGAGADVEDESVDLAGDDSVEVEVALLESLAAVLAGSPELVVCRLSLR